MQFTLINKDKQFFHTELLKSGFKFSNRSEVQEHLKKAYDEQIAYSLSVKSIEEPCIRPYNILLLIKNKICIRVDISAYDCFVEKWDEELMLIDASLIHDWKEEIVKENDVGIYYHISKKFKYKNFSILFYYEKRYDKLAKNYITPLFGGGKSLVIEQIN